MKLSSTFFNAIQLFCITFFFICIPPAIADSTDDANQVFQSIVHSFDYVSVDYAGVLEDGKVVDQDEYDEQLEIAQHLLSLMQTLPENPQKPVLVEQAKTLLQAVQQKASPDDVAALCRESITKLISSYDFSIAPSVIPSLAEGKKLYNANCVACHGPTGLGDGVQATELAPKPANFHDRSRQQFRNIYSLYNTISLGVAETAMQPFSQFSAEQRWALAFYIANFYASDTEIAEGQKLWAEHKFENDFANIQQLTQAEPSQVLKNLGEDGLAVLAYLRANPQLLQQDTLTPLNKSRDYLIASLSAYKQGNNKEAYEKALAAYFEGFELVESKLKTIASELRLEIEHEMSKYRAMINDSVNPADVEKQQQHLLSLLGKADNLLNTTGASASVNFMTSMLILLREGLEAILVLAAIVAVLIKSGRRDAIWYIHAGWISALLLGLFTWYVASNLIVISGAHRELTEGITAIIAAVMLLYVGFWLHNQSNAMQWQKFVKNKISSSLTNGALFGLASMAFIAVYREVFESVLFYQSLMLNSPESQQSYIIGGILTAAGLLILLAWLIMRYSVRLPLRAFFRVNMLLMFLLAVVFAGKGIAALQEAGVVPQHPVDFPSIELLGVFPSMEGLGLQSALVCLALLWGGINYLKAKS